MKIATKSGDEGETSLFGGRRISKGEAIFEVLGGLDELQSVLGWCRFGVGAERGSEASEVLDRLQDDMYRAMAIVGFEMKTPKNIETISEVDVAFLEERLETYEKMVGGITKFVRPGTSEAAARFHIARSVCRRVERVVVRYNAESEAKLVISPEILKYLNRLSDLLFVIAYSFEVEIKT